MENIRGIRLMILSMFAFATADVFIKILTSAGITTGQICLMLGFGGTIIFSAICLWRSENPLPRSFFDPAVLMRNLGEVMGSFGIITSISLTSLSTTSSIQQATPLVVTMGAALVLGETVGWRRWSAIIVGFCCMILIIRPGMDGFDSNSLFAVLGVFGLSLRDLATKRIKADVSTMQLSVFGYIVLIPLGIFLFANQTNTYGNNAITLYSCLAIIAMVLFSMLAYVTITMSVRLGDISAVIPFRYSRILFAMIFGIFLFHERPDWQTYVGVIGLILSGLFLMTRERSIKTTLP